MTHGDETDVGSRNSIFRALADDRRRRILAALSNRRSSTDVTELTALLAATRHEPPLDVSDERREHVRTDLVHVQLPALADAGLVAWDERTATVTTTDHPALRDRTFQRILESDVEGLDDGLLALASERRRFVLTTLADERSPTSIASLARALSRRETGTFDPDSTTVDDVAVSLHHVHLPKLEDLGLVEFDPETGRVAYDGHPVLDKLFAPAESNDRLVDRVDGFFGELGSAYRRANWESSDPFDWPRDWTDSHHG